MYLCVIIWTYSSSVFLCFLSPVFFFVCTFSSPHISLFPLFSSSSYPHSICLLIHSSSSPSSPFPSFPPLLTLPFSLIPLSSSSFSLFPSFTHPPLLLFPSSSRSPFPPYSLLSPSLLSPHLPSFRSLTFFPLSYLNSKPPLSPFLPPSSLPPSLSPTLRPTRTSTW